MFTVYGLNGQIFSGPLEGLRELGPVQSVARLRAIEPLRPPSEQTSDSASVLLGAPNPDASLVGNAEPRQQEALAAYAQMQAGVPPRQTLSLVHELMSRRLISVPVTASLAQGLSLLSHEKVGQAAVLDERGLLVGLLLRADLLPLPESVGDAAAWASWLQRPVSEVMWTPVPSVVEDTPIREVAQVLLDLGLPGLPVLDAGGNLQGFLSRTDILRALTRKPPIDLWS
jgi:CBS domain-containing protein